MKSFCVLFSHGLSGTWLTWFINQHSGFPIRLDLVGEYSDPAFPNRITDYSTKSDWWSNEQSWKEFIAYVNKHDNSTNYNKVAFKVLPNHEFFGPEVDTEQAQRNARHALVESNSRQVIVPIVNTVFVEAMYNRLVAIRPQHVINPKLKNWWNEELYTYIEEEINVPVLRLDIGKIFNVDDTEYNKLLKVLDVPALHNWKEIVNNCVDEIYGNYK